MKQKVAIWSCNHILDFAKKPKFTTVWEPPAGKDYSIGHWAPELHAVQGRWYIYTGGTSEQTPAKSRRIYVLGGPPASEEPTTGPWEFLGKIKGMPDAWAIDGTCFELEKQLYFAYSGRPWWHDKPGKRGRQSIYIFKMADAITAASDPVMIAEPEFDWEFNGKTGVGTDEGPQFLAAPDGSWHGLTFSCGGAGSTNYKMGTLKYLGGDPLERRSWSKSNEPLLQTSKGRPPFGPGHGNFITVGEDVFSIFHATNSPTDGVKNRKVRISKVMFNREGPHMGRFAGPLVNVDLFQKNMKRDVSEIFQRPSAIQSPVDEEDSSGNEEEVDNNDMGE